MRSLPERIVHTLLFEVLGVLIVTPIMSWVTGATVGAAGTLSVIVSTAAVVSNYLWTIVYDWLVPTRDRSFVQRVLQSVGLEAIVALYTVPLVMVFTEVSFTEAVVIDLSGVAFFLLFGIVYNLAFDAVMMRLHGRA